MKNRTVQYSYVGHVETRHAQQLPCGDRSRLDLVSQAGAQSQLCPPIPLRPHSPPHRPPPTSCNTGNSGSMLCIARVARARTPCDRGGSSSLSFASSEVWTSLIVCTGPLCYCAVHRLVVASVAQHTPSRNISRPSSAPWSPSPPVVRHPPSLWKLRGCRALACLRAHTGLWRTWTVQVE